MASPQIENGYTQIANEILEHLCYAGINGSEYRLIFVVIRKTYGFHKLSDRIALSQFEQFTGMKRAQAVDTIRSLLEKRILVVVDGKFAFNKNYEEWGVGKRLPRPGGRQKPTGGVGNSLPIAVGNSLPTKETIKENNKTYRMEGAEVIKLMEEVDPKNKEYYSNTSQRRAADFLIEQYGLDTVISVIKLLPRTNSLPYFPTITTPVQLRDKWVQLQNTVERKKSELSKTNILDI